MLLRLVALHIYSYLSLSLLFFKSFGSHLVLLSFPTRRSSDLPRRAPASAWSPRAPPRRRGSRAVPRRRRRRARCGPRATERDRKSTRLNSSHEWISYAVFCLKKKIEL